MKSFLALVTEKLSLEQERGIVQQYLTIKTVKKRLRCNQKSFSGLFRLLFYS